MHRPTLLLFAIIAVAAPLSTVAREPENATQPKRVLLLGQSPDNHPRGTHEYMGGMKILAACLKQVEQLETEIVKADDPWTDGPDRLADVDGAVLFVSEGAKWIQGDPRRFEAFAKLAQRGGGLVVLHWGMGGRDAQYIDGFVNLFGGCHGGPDRRYKVFDSATVKLAHEKHPVLRGIKPFQLREEFYYRLKFVKSDSAITPLLQTEVDGNLETVGWAWERPGGGRSFGFSGGHFHDNWRREEYRRLMAHAVLWTVKLPVPEQGLTVDLPASTFEFD